MKRIRQLYADVNENFRTLLAEKFYDKFSLKIDTQYDIINGRLVSTRLDGLAFSTEQNAWLEAFGLGYVAVMCQIVDAD